jgi:hypothetical protein
MKRWLPVRNVFRPKQPEISFRDMSLINKENVSEAYSCLFESKEAQRSKALHNAPHIGLGANSGPLVEFDCNLVNRR